MEPEEVKKTLLVSALYYEDTPEPNAGLKARHEITKNGTFSTLAPLHGDIFTCQQYFPRMTDYRLELYRNSDNFLLIASKESNEEYGLLLIKAELLLNVIYPLPSFALAYERMLIKTPAQFNIKKTVIKVLHLSAGMMDLPNTCVHTGVIPRRVIMMMVPSVDFFGKLTSNPFNFKSFTLERYQLKANDKLYPSDPQTMDFVGKDAVEMYRQLFDGLAGSSQMCSITYSQFLSGYTFIITDLSPDASGGSGKVCPQCLTARTFVSAHIQPIEQGTLSVELKLKDAVPAETSGLKLIFYLEWDDVFFCDSQRHFIPANMS